MKSFCLGPTARALLVAASAGAATGAHAATAVIANGDIAATIADAGYFSAGTALGLSWRNNEFVNAGTFQSWYRLTVPAVSFAAEEHNNSNPFSAFIESSGPSGAKVVGGSIPISFTQTFAMPSADRLTVAVTLTNNTASAIDHVQWGVGLDPDQDHATHGDYLTINTITGVGDSAGVSATGRISGFTVTLRNTTGPSVFAASAFIAAGDCCTAGATSIALASGQPLGFQDVNDSSISLAFDFGTLGAGGSVAFSYAYDMSLVPVTPPVPEPGTYAMMLAGLGLIGLGALRRRGS